MKYCNVIKEIEKVPTIKFLDSEENWYSVKHCVYAVFRIVKSGDAYYAYIAHGLGVDAEYVKLGSANYLYVKGKDGNKCTRWEDYNKIRISDTEEILKAINNLHKEVKVCENELKKLFINSGFSFNWFNRWI